MDLQERIDYKAKQEMHSDLQILGSKVKTIFESGQTSAGLDDMKLVQALLEQNVSIMRFFRNLATYPNYADGKNPSHYLANLWFPLYVSRESKKFYDKIDDLNLIDIYKSDKDIKQEIDSLRKEVTGQIDNLSKAKRGGRHV